MTFDLDLWPTDLNINRDHLFTKDYLPTKFEASGAKRYWVISCTRLRATDIPTDRPTYRPTYRHTDRQVQSNMPLLFQRGHEYGSKVKRYNYIVCVVRVISSEVPKFTFCICTNDHNSKDWLAFIFMNNLYLTAKVIWQKLQSISCP